MPAVSQDRKAGSATASVVFCDPVSRSRDINAVAGQLRQQGGQRLGLGLQGGQAGGLSLAQLRVVLQGALIDGQQIRRRMRRFAATHKANYDQQVAS